MYSIVYVFCLGSVISRFGDLFVYYYLLFVCFATGSRVKIIPFPVYIFTINFLVELTIATTFETIRCFVTSQQKIN